MLLSDGTPRKTTVRPALGDPLPAQGSVRQTKTPPRRSPPLTPLAAGPSRRSMKAARYPSLPLVIRLQRWALPAHHRTSRTASDRGPVQPCTRPTPPGEASARASDRANSNSGEPSLVVLGVAVGLFGVAPVDVDVVASRRVASSSKWKAPRYAHSFAASFLPLAESGILVWTVMAPGRASIVVPAFLRLLQVFAPGFGRLGARLVNRLGENRRHVGRRTVAGSQRGGANKCGRATVGPADVHAAASNAIATTSGSRWLRVFPFRSLRTGLRPRLEGAEAAGMSHSVRDPTLWPNEKTA